MKQKPMPKVFILRDYSRCSGCRMCEVVCALKHEGVPDPLYARIKVFEYVPGIPVPQLCVQCPDYPCVDACKFGALRVDERTGAVVVDREKCVACGSCIVACPGNIPRRVKGLKYVLICDLCGGDPECVKVCQRLGHGALIKVDKHPGYGAKLYAVSPEMVQSLIVRKLLNVEV